MHTEFITKINTNDYLFHYYLFTVMYTSNSLRFGALRLKVSNNFVTSLTL